MAETILAPPGAKANKRTIEDKLLLAINQMKNIKDSMDLIQTKANADVGASDIKDLSRAVEDIAQVTRFLCRDALGSFESSS